MSKYEVYIDGSIGPVNPGGTASYGVYILLPDGSPHEDWGILGSGEKMSNNTAEYGALRKAFGIMKKFHYLSDFEIYSDSALVVNQMKHAWDIKKGLYKEEAMRCRHMALAFPNICYFWIPREKNFFADELSKRALKESGYERWIP